MPPTGSTPGTPTTAVHDVLVDPSAACGSPYPPPSLPGRLEPHEILVKEPSKPLGVNLRHFQLRLPTQYDSTVPLPLVIDIHGFGSSSTIQLQNSGFANISEDRGFVGVWPDGSGDCLGEYPGCEHSWQDCSACNQGWNAVGTAGGASASAAPTCNIDRDAWGAYDCYESCGAACAPTSNNTTRTCLSASCWDDVQFITELLDWLEDRVCLDRNRVHLSGLSNGAMMTLQLAHSIGHRIASIVPVAGLPLLGFVDQAVPTSPVAMMAINGQLDQVMPANISNGFLGQAGPLGSTYSSDGFYYTPISNLTHAWREVNQCGSSDAHRVYPTPRDGELWWHCVEPFGACGSGSALVRCTTLGGHTWPDFAKNQTDCYTDECAEDGGNCPFVKFAEIAWTFMEANPRPAAAAPQTTRLASF